MVLTKSSKSLCEQMTKSRVAIWFEESVLTSKSSSRAIRSVAAELIRKMMLKDNLSSETGIIIVDEGSFGLSMRKTCYNFKLVSKEHEVR